MVYVDGLTRDCSDPLVSFVHETVLGSDRGWVNSEQVLETRPFVVHTFVQCVVEIFFFEKTEANYLTPFLLVTVAVELAFVA